MRPHLFALSRLAITALHTRYISASDGRYVLNLDIKMSTIMKFSEVEHNVKSMSSDIIIFSY